MPSIEEAPPLLIQPLAPALKRKLAEVEKSESKPTSPVKRQRVDFSSDVNVRLLRNPNERPLRLVRQEIERAIEQRREGDSSEYDALKSRLHLKPNTEDGFSDSELRTYVLAFTALPHAMGKECGGMVNALLNCGWLRRDERLLADFQRFLTTLMSAHSGYTPPILRWLVQRFTEPPSRPTGNLADIDLSEFLDRVHNTLQHIVKFVPSSLGVLENTITTNFPFHLAESRHHITYTTNLLRLTGYCRPLATSILQIVMESMVTIDIKIVVEIEDLDDDETEKIMADVAQQQAEIAAQGDEDIVGLENGVTQDDDDDIDEDDPEQALRIIKDHMLKLDGMISLLFQHLDRELSSGSPEQNSITFDQIVSIFRRSVLTTHNSRHTQYLLFRFTQLYPDLYTRFMKSLGSVAFDRNRSIAIRISAISYLASFAARGSKVTRDDVRAIFDMLCREMERLRAGYDLANYGPDPDRFRFYYAMFQACMYIFCFRWRDFSLEPEDVDEHPILDDTEELKWSPEIKEAFTRHIYCSVNPLKACSPLIVEMFAKVTKALNFLYLYSILETNKRVRLLRSVMSSAIRESALSKSQSEASLQLEAHYAFEPYLLPSSKHWVDDLYQDFDSLAPPGMEPDDSSDDDAPENEAEFGEEGTATDEE